MLEGKGYSVSTAGRIDDVDDSLDEQVPDLILLDIWVGGNDGREMAKRLKTDERTKTIPIVVLSANLSTPQIAKDIKADDFVLKPFDVDHLLVVVEKRLHKQAKLLSPPANRLPESEI